VGMPELDSISAMERIDYYKHAYSMGRKFIADANFRKAVCDSKGWEFVDFGEIGYRPTDRRENYVKRCVGLPGQTLEIKDRIIYLDGKENKTPENAQFTYFVKLNNISIYDLLGDQMDDLRKELQITKADITQLGNYGFIPLTNYAAQELKRRGIVSDIKPVTDSDYPSGDTYPLNGNKHWTRDNYGPIWIPKKGESIDLTLDNIAVYERPIKVYEHNDLDIRDGKIFINGQEAKSYTFKMDYYWMMGDNRHNSADSRYWGFVPEDHIVGKPIFIWLSSDPDHHGFSGIRWSRLFRMVDNIK